LTLTKEVIEGAKKQYEAGLMSKEFYETTINMPGPEYVAPILVYLASEKAANINGQVFHIKKGKIAIYSDPVEKFVLYKTDNDGMWTVEDFENHVPESLLVGYINPAPPQSTK